MSDRPIQSDSDAPEEEQPPADGDVTPAEEVAEIGRLEELDGELADRAEADDPDGAISEGDDTDDELDDDDEFDEDFGGLPAPAPAVGGLGDVPEGHRSGFVCFVGRPNAGKSTLTNALVGTKVVITSDKPQTTRTVVRGIVHRPDAQLILVDTPGLHRPRTLLGERLNDLVMATWAEVDVVACCFPANEKIGPGDRFIVGELAKIRRGTRVAIATKTDLATPDQLAAHLASIAELGRETGTDWAEIVPVSAVSGDQVGLLSDLLVGLLPEGPQFYPDGDLTDAPEEILVAELIREAALEGAREELPHSIAVVVDEMNLREGRPKNKPLLDIYASLFVERDSQKGIIIGHRGKRLSAIGSVARKQIEALLGTPVYLDLRVKVAKDWQRDPRQLGKLGF